MDAVICLSLRDVHIVKKTVNAIRHNLHQVDENIYILTSSFVAKLLSHRWARKYGVIVIDEDKLIPNLSYSEVDNLVKQYFTCNARTGWYMQQFLKMGFALSKYAKDEYLIWDSDTIPLREIEFKNGNNFTFTPKSEYHKPYFDTLNRLLGIGKEYPFSFIAEHMIIKTSVMRELIADLSQSNLLWFQNIIYSTDATELYAFSEFETYGTYCMKKYPNLYELRDLHTFREAGLKYGRMVSKSELSNLAKDGYDTASFEHYHLPSYPRRIFSRLELLEYKILVWIKSYISK